MKKRIQIENPDGSIVDYSNISLESLGVHLMFGDVNNESMKSAIEFIIKSNILYTDDITIIFNTMGGETSEGFALIDVMEASKLNIKTIGMGNIISMGMLLICSGTRGKRFMLKNSCAMAHQFTGWSQGKFHELISAQKAFEYLKIQMTTHFLRNTKMNEKQVEDIMFGPSDRYLTPAECRKFGIIDEVIDELPELNLDLSPEHLVQPVRKSRRQSTK